MAQEVLKEAGETFGRVLKDFGIAYIASTVSNSLKPAFVGVVTQCLDDAKNQVAPPADEKKGAVPDPLGGTNQGADVKDAFNMTLDSCSIKNSGWDFSFTAYTFYCIRIGTGAGGKFFAMGKKFTVDYGVLQRMHRTLADEISKNKWTPALPALPPTCRHGTYCFCLTYNDSMVDCENNTRNFIKAIVKDYPSSETLPNYWRLPADFEAQEKAWTIFEEAVMTTRAKVAPSASAPALPPFDEGDAVLALLKSVARAEICTKLHEKMAPPVPIECIQAQARRTADDALLASMSTVFNASWPKIQEGVQAVGKKANEVISTGADKLMAELKPLVQKIVDIIKSKLKKKEEKKEPQGQLAPSVGDMVEKWKFQQTDIGREFFDNLGRADAQAAMQTLTDKATNAMEIFLREKFEQGTKRLLGDDIAAFDIVLIILEMVAEQVVKTINKYTTLEHLMKSAVPLFDCRRDLEKSLSGVKDKPDEIAAVLTRSSGEMWAKMPAACLDLFIAVDKLKGKIQSELNNVCAAGVAPLTKVADDLFNLQVKALNSIRVQFINGVRAKMGTGVASDAAVEQIVRETWREVTFGVIHAVVKESWMKLAEAFTLSAIAQVKDKFYSEVWPTIASGLEELAALIPEVVKSMGLDIVGLAKSLVDIILEKAVRWAITKLIVKLEVVLFEQMVGTR